MSQPPDRTSESHFRSVWEALPHTQFARVAPHARSRYVGDRLSFREKGPANLPAIVMLHGIGSHAAYFAHQFEALSPHHRVIAWNAPGYWLSDALVTEQPSDLDYANALADLLDALDLSRVVLCGNSFGSAVAQAFAIHHPSRLSHLVLSGTGVGQKSLSSERRAAFEARAQRVRQGAHAYADAGVDALLGSQASDSLRTHLIDIAKGIQSPGLLAAVSFRLSNFYSPDWAHCMKVPVLMIQGSEDRVNVQSENADLLKAALGEQARLEVLPGVGHLPEVEAPAQFNSLLQAFMAE